MENREQELAKQLVTEVEKRLNTEAPQLQWRIRNALAYLQGVNRPNAQTLKHVRRFLTGAYDNMGISLADDTESTSESESLT